NRHPDVRAAQDEGSSSTPKSQLHPRNAGEHIQPDLTADTERLQGEGIIGPAIKHIGTKTGADGGSGGDTAVIAGEVAEADLLRRREHAPDKARHRGGAEIDAGATDRGTIGLPRPDIRTINAIQVGDRADDKANG